MSAASFTHLYTCLRDNYRHYYQHQRHYHYQEQLHTCAAPNRKQAAVVRKTLSETDPKILVPYSEKIGYYRLYRNTYACYSNPILTIEKPNQILTSNNKLAICCKIVNFYHGNIAI